jgi:DNA-binding NarL/FixJ family response regulator
VSSATQPAPRRSATQDKPIRIVIADDNAIVRDGLRAHIMAQTGLDVIGEATDGEEACACARTLRPDVLLLDISMPGMSGLEAAERIVADCPTVRIIVLTMHEERSYVARLTDAGAVGYVLKRTAATSLVPAITAVAAGGSYLDPAIVGDPGSDVVGRSATNSGLDQSEELTGPEARLLRLLAQGQSNQEIAATLGWSIANVALQRGTGMTKLGLQSRAALLRHVTEHGWLGLES